jgi:hypothetical protein
VSNYSLAAGDPVALVKVDWAPRYPQLRTFGVACGAICLALGLCARRRYPIAIPSFAAVRVAYAFWGLAIVTTVSAWLTPQAFRPFYLALTVIARRIGSIVSYPIAAILFYGVLTPLGLVYRLADRVPRASHGSLERLPDQPRTPARHAPRDRSSAR